MALRLIVALACMQVALANPLAGYYGGPGYLTAPTYYAPPSPCHPPPCHPPPCAPPPIQIIEQPVPQPVIQEVGVPVPQAVPVTIPNPTFLDSNTRITTVSGSNGGEVQSTTTGSWNPNGPLPCGHQIPVQANPWAYTAPAYPVLSPILYGNSLFGPLL